LQILKVFENYTSTKTITLSCFHALHSLTEVYIADCYAEILRYGELLFRRRTFAFLPTTDTFVNILAFYDCLWARCCILWSPNRQARFLRFTARVHMRHLQTNRSRRQPPDGITTNGKCTSVWKVHQMESAPQWTLTLSAWSQKIWIFCTKL